MGKIQKNITSKDELETTDAVAYLFLSGDQVFFEKMNVFAKLRVQFKSPEFTGYFQSLSLDEVKRAWESTYRAKANGAGTKPPAHFYFDEGKTSGNGAYRSWKGHKI